MWALSVGLHLLIVVLVIVFAKKQTEQVPLPKVKKPLQSYLFVPLIQNKAPEQIPKEPPENIPLLNSPNDKPKTPPEKIIEATLDNKIQQGPEPKTADNVAVINQPLEVKEGVNTPKVEVPNSQQNKPNISEQTSLLLNQNNLNKTIKLPSKNIPNAISKNEKASHLARQHLQTIQNAFVEQQAKQYRKEKVHPEINTNTAIDTITPQLKEPVIEIDCNSTAKQSLAFISNLGGGTVNCRNSKAFQQYIDKRLNKTN